ncbi:MAG: 50S ribosomal protein L4 [Candidatus Pacearchaeota archaeon]
MKAKLYDEKGNAKSTIELPAVFSSSIREDIVAKYFEAFKQQLTQPYATFSEAGKRHSASGRLFHRRHKWRTQYGKGISRVPRKTMYRHGTQFYWIGAEVSPTRGGRVAHPPRGLKRFRKINEKEIKLAMNSAFASTASKDYVAKRYTSISEMKDAKSVDAPFIIESLPLKTSDALESLKRIFGSLFQLVLKKKVVRAGKGKSRGRKYKSNAGLLLVFGDDEKIKIKGVDAKPISQLRITDLYPLGRLTLYTKKAIEQLNAQEKGGKK